ncbi:MAG: GGDEF domain-containing protein [Hyphomonas oceanitis]
MIDSIRQIFWAQQIRFVVLGMLGALVASTLAAWFTTADLTLHGRVHTLVVSVVLTCTVAACLLGYSVRLNVRYLRLHLQTQLAAYSDTLTGLANRRAFLSEGELRLAQPSQAGHHAALLVVDIDWFKRVNDMHGHEAGDETLVHIAQTLLHATPANALVSRIGGEEFTILTDVTDTEHLEQLAGALCKSAEAASFYYRGERISVTVSIGLSLATPGDTLSALLSRADKALYDAKRHGRNQFLLAA